jgi:hypothetical protein
MKLKHTENTESTSVCSDIVAEWGQLEQHEPEIPPKGAITLRDYATAFDISMVHAGTKLRRLVAEGKVKKLKVRSNPALARAVIYYLPVK